MNSCLVSFTFINGIYREWNKEDGGVGNPPLPYLRVFQRKGKGGRFSSFSLICIP